MVWTNKVERERGREGVRERERERERERGAVAATRIVVKVNFGNYAFLLSSREETLVLG